MPRSRDRKHGAERPYEKPEFDQKVLDLRRTARVVSGGRRFSFRTAMVVGDRMGRVGLGIGKGPDVATSVEKAVFQAKKNMIRIPLNAAKTIPHEVKAKFAAARIILKPGREGRGLIAGGPIRVIADLGGIKNMTAKILGRTVNKLNNGRAMIEALKKLKAQSEKRNVITQDIKETGIL